MSLIGARPIRHHEHMVLITATLAIVLTVSISTACLLTAMRTAQRSRRMEIERLSGKIERLANHSTTTTGIERTLSANDG